MAPIFTADFNSFKSINATKAWSLFFTASQADTFLGENPMIGRYLTIGLLSVVIAGAVEVALFAA
ncbi:hypothetical protein Pse7367_3487 [Thalassoporum mexicanum PCC 7367]|uniref:hypothetical protein n=1 Tax=Thalassoporum mexicanum TaxID=3457544 RepID=UPI00029F8E97|nr:hypothetical protein [Pseudanabaena sp. PCC 7367]AFY71723.1 hypothetical protein Pse7367_3487 [Pseudanabaena sp. PCC 7367]